MQNIEWGEIFRTLGAAVFVMLLIGIMIYG